MAIDHEGRIVVVGASLFGSTNWDFAAARLTAGGNLDNAFGNNGVYGRAVEAAEDGRMPPVSGVRVHDNNVLNGDQLKGCDLPGVSCPGN